MSNTGISRKEKQREGVASLFDAYEIKDIFRRYGQLLIILEVLIFLVCWVYQLGIDEVAVTGKPVDVPFPWKMYFLIAFTAPLAVTFVAGVAVTAFNSFIYGRKARPIFKEQKDETGYIALLVRIANFCCQLPVLLLLLLLGVSLAVVYNAGVILQFLGRFGEAAVRYTLFGFGAVLVVATLFIVLRMILQYKLRRSSMEYEYRRNVMEKLGIAILDEKTVVDSQGRLVSRPLDIEVTDMPPWLPNAEKKALPEAEIDDALRDAADKNSQAPSRDCNAAEESGPENLPTSENISVDASEKKGASSE